MGLNYLASSPTVVLPLQQPSHYFADINSSHRRSLSPSAMASYTPKNPVPPSLNYLAAASNATAGRKRSISDVDPEDHSQDGSYISQLPPKPKPEPICGPGMTLIYPDEPGFHISAESQTGTLAEKKYNKLEKEEPSARPVLASRKSQRLDVSAKDDAHGQQSLDFSNDEQGNTISTLANALGIGWKRVAATQSRAYTRVIERQFDMKVPEVMLHSEALSVYLVRVAEYSRPCFYLFHDSLQWCQLVGRTPEETYFSLSAPGGPNVQGPKIEAQPTAPSSLTDDVEISPDKGTQMDLDDADEMDRTLVAREMARENDAREVVMDD